MANKQMQCWQAQIKVFQSSQVAQVQVKQQLFAVFWKCANNKTGECCSVRQQEERQNDLVKQAVWKQKQFIVRLKWIQQKVVEFSIETKIIHLMPMWLLLMKWVWWMLDCFIICLKRCVQLHALLWLEIKTNFQVWEREMFCVI